MSKNLHLLIASCLLLLGNTSCFDTATTLCATGIRCPVDQGCAANQPVCITGLCGNGLLDVGEVCDDGNIISGDDCSADCLSVEVCGNGITDPAKGEECDDAGESESCDTDCSFAACGDGTVNISNNEECDAAGENAVCDADCTLALCGDGLPNRMAGEVCDDGGETLNCDTDCTRADCGDGTVNKSLNEECDDRTDSQNCDSDCTLSECGDGYPNHVAGEICDGGGETETCDIDCTPVDCGDGVVNATAGEECDTPFDTPECVAGICNDTSRCGDNHINITADEECDDGDEDYGGNGCTRDCKHTEGITCTPSSLPGELNDLGTPEAPTGLTLSMKSFLVSDNDIQTYLVKKPRTLQHLALPLVTRYDPNEDHDYGWSITWEDADDSIKFTIETKHATDNPTAHIAGRLLVFGFDGVLSGFAGGLPSGYPGNAKAIEIQPRMMDRRTKVAPLAYTTSYLTGKSDDLDWDIKKNETGECTYTFDSITNKDDAIVWHANSLLLAEPIRVQRKPFDIQNNNADIIEFKTTPRADQIWLPIVENYHKGSDEDLAYAIDCVQGSDALTCTAITWDGDSGSRISGYVLLLESLSGFSPCCI